MKKKKKGRLKRKRMFRFGCEIIILLCLSGLLFLYYEYFRMGHIKLKKNEIAVSADRHQGATHYLILFQNEEKNLEEFLMIAAAKPEEGRAILYAVDTDSYWDGGEAGWLTCKEFVSSYSESELMNVLNLNLNLAMEDFFIVKSEDFCSGINLLGGIESEQALWSGEAVLAYIRDGAYIQASEGAGRFLMAAAGIGDRLMHFGVAKRLEMTNEFLYGIQTSISFGEFLYLLRNGGRMSIDYLGEIQAGSTEITELF